MSRLVGLLIKGPFMMTTVDWTGSSGTKYTLDVFRLGTAVPSYAGVYVLCRKGEHGWQRYYVGEAENIQTRLSDSRHPGRDCAMRNGASFVATTSIAGGKDARLDVEHDLVAAFCPRCNE